jgi:hypothetical protein
LRVLLVVLALAGSRAAKPVLRALFEGSDSSDKAIAQLQQAKAREVAKAASAAQQANTAIEAARRSTSLPTAQSKQREAPRLEANAVRHQHNAAELERRIAQKQGNNGNAMLLIAGLARNPGEQHT